MTQIGKIIASGLLVASLVFSLIACIAPTTSTPGHSPTSTVTQQLTVSSTARSSVTVTWPPTIMPSLTPTPQPTLTPWPTSVASEPQGRILFTAVYAEQELVLPREAPTPRDIWVINVDGTGQRLWIEDEQYTYSPHVSPDGTRVAYYTHPAENEPQLPGLWIANVDGTQRRQIDYLQGVTQPETVKGFILEAWSPNGEWLSYLLSGPGDWMRDSILWLYALHLPTGRTTLVCGPQFGISSQWIPIEKTVLTYQFQRSSGDSYPSDYHFRVDVTRPQDVRRVDGPLVGWIPTGQKWAFSRDPYTDTGTIKMLAPDGSVAYQIVMPNLKHAQWSPDGQWIACRTIRQVQFPKERVYMEELWIMDSQGRQRRQLISHEQFDLSYMPLVWSPDSAWLACIGTPSEQFNEFGFTPERKGPLLLLNVSTGQMIRLLEEIHPYFGFSPMAWVQ